MKVEDCPFRMKSRQTTGTEVIRLLENYPYIQQLKQQVKKNPSVFLGILFKRLKQTNKDLYVLLLQNRNIVASYLSL
jgi:hypothetical protein